jgi:PAS domain S-box-containing protein
MKDYKIMIVEDEKIVATDIKKGIEKMGYSVCATVSSGIDAIKKVEAERPDIILMDIVLKGKMDGIEAASIIRDLYKIPVVYLTAFGEDSILQRAKVTEPYGYIIKPFREKDLQIAIELSIYKNHVDENLRLQQRKLKKQNEELRHAQDDLAASRARYFNLYDLAPVGYISVSETGLILEANQTSANLLGTARDELKKQPLTMFILAEDQDIYRKKRKELFESGEPQKCELRMVKKDGTVFWVMLDAIAAKDNEGAPDYRVVLSDITAQKQLDGKWNKISL